MSRFGKLADKQREPVIVSEPVHVVPMSSTPPPSRVGRKAISGYFSPEMSLALHVCARRNGLNLQALMAEAFDDVLRNMAKARSVARQDGWR